MASECNQIQELALLQQSGECTEIEKSEVDQHLATCEFCREELRVYQYILDQAEKELPSMPKHLRCPIDASVKPKSNWNLGLKALAACCCIGFGLFFLLKSEGNKPESQSKEEVIIHLNQPVVFDSKLHDQQLVFQRKVAKRYWVELSLFEDHRLNHLKQRVKTLKQDRIF